jgi:hypothetical protein
MHAHAARSDIPLNCAFVVSEPQPLSSCPWPSPWSAAPVIATLDDDDVADPSEDEEDFEGAGPRPSSWGVQGRLHVKAVLLTFAGLFRGELTCRDVRDAAREQLRGV